MTGVSDRFGSVIRAKRRSRGLSQEALAELADLNRSYLGKIERGIAIPSLETVEKLSQAFGETLAALIAECEIGND